jgi:hypothetical protein
MRRLTAALLLILTPALQAATFVVDTTSDNLALSACTATAADCSLRGAISRANATDDADDIAFDIPTSESGCDAGTGICRIEVTGSFSISRPLAIDGYTQPGALPNTIPAPGANNAQLKIEITSAGFVNLGLGLFDHGQGSAGSPFIVRGLAIALPSSGIIGRGGFRHDIRGNWFCVDASGQSLDFTPPCSVFNLSGQRFVQVGGPDPADRNVIAGGGRNAAGLPFGGSNRLGTRSSSTERGQLLVQGNLIGLAPDGITALPMRDPFSVNTGDDAFQTPDIRVLDNRFARAPRDSGGGFGGALQVSISRVMNEVVPIQGNVFGLGVDGSVVGVEKDHIEVFLGNSSRVPRLLIGGLGAGEGNVFSGALRQSFTGLSLGSAVILPNGSVTTFVEFVGNRMLGNQGIGLDFPTPTTGGGVAVGRTLNDSGDPDIGANRQQNHPEISGFSVNASQFDVTYRVDSAPANSSYPLRVDFYKALGDEGEVLLDSDVYAEVDAQQDKSVTLMIPPGVELDNDDVLVAIATDAEGRSSEFSFDTLALAISDTPDPHPAGLPVTIEATAIATPGPFKPNGVVEISMATSPATTCTISLQPTATANTSAGRCQLIPVQTGNRLITATYRTLQGAFGSADGQDVVITEPHTVTAPGPEQVSLPSCLGVALEARDLIVDVRRPSGGVATVQVDLQHEAGTATPGVDYIAPPEQTLTWGPGDIAPKLIVIPITADGSGEAVETFRLRLLDPVNTAIVPHALIEYRILDGDDRGFADGFEGDCPDV